jgi:hypothetical protein
MEEEDGVALQALGMREQRQRGDILLCLGHLILAGSPGLETNLEGGAVLRFPILLQDQRSQHNKTQCASRFSIYSC